jgi:hypothetical protein
MAIETLATLDELREFLGITTPTAQQTMVLDVVRRGAQKTIDNFLGASLIQATHTEYYPQRAHLSPHSELIDSFERSGNKVVPLQRYVSNRRILQLAKLPVRSIVSVYENADAWSTEGGDWPVANLLDGDSYFIDALENGISWSGFLINNTGPWSAVERSIKVQYVAGFTAEEINNDYPDLRYAYFSLCQVDYNQAMMQMMGRSVVGSGVGLITAEHIDTWGVQYDATTNAQLYGFTGRMPLMVARTLEPYVNFTRFIG